jgi:CheY-like chemotaxis protein
MSRLETDHRIPETPAAVPAHPIGDSSRVFSTVNSGAQAVREEEHAAREAASASMCAQFLVDLSHQMRTRLSSLLGVTQMMLEGSVSDAQKEFVETVEDSARALASMADAISDFSRRLMLQDPRLQASPTKLNGNGLAVIDHGPNGNGSHPIATPAIAPPGAQEMLAKDLLTKTTSGRDRLGTFNAASFRSRVPPDTAKLIRILVAEDHQMNQEVMLRMLARLGFRADAVSNGLEAVAALTRSPYDLVLMDCQMPELDGYEATRRIRSNGGRFKSTPIIAVTASAMEGDREKCLASGMSDYMSKPVLAQTLAATLEKWILPDAAGGAIGPLGPPLAVDSASALTSAADAHVAAASQPALEAEAKVADEDIGAAVDTVALETLRAIDAGDEGFMKKIIELFLADLTERLEAMKAAAQARDGGALKRIAHALKGSCGHFGAARLATLCRKIEQLSAQQPPADAGETLLELAAEAQRVRAALEEAKPSSSTNSVTMEESD